MVSNIFKHLQDKKKIHSSQLDSYQQVRSNQCEFLLSFLTMCSVLYLSFSRALNSVFYNSLKSSTTSRSRKGTLPINFTLVNLTWTAASSQTGRKHLVKFSRHISQVGSFMFSGFITDVGKEKYYIYQQLNLKIFIIFNDIKLHIYMYMYIICVYTYINIIYISHI